MDNVGSITPEIFAMPHNKGKTHIPSTGGGTRGSELGFEEQIWTIGGWSLTTLSLLMRYNCHINVEACSSIKAVKYLFKYIYKGHDRTSFACEQDIINDGGIINEIRQYRDARYVSPPEAIFRIFRFKLFGVSPSVLQLQLHLPNMHTVAFKACENLEDVVARPSSSKTMLTEYFEMNRKFPVARNLLYREFPEHYRWIAGKKWQNRKTKRLQIGRLVYAHPAEGERYYLRVLLSHVRGPTSFDALKTVNGNPSSSFREACEQLGLIEHDRTIDDCMMEAATFQIPSALRRLFATILVFCEVTDIRQLWDKHLASMSEDYRRNQSNDVALEQMVLRDIRDMLQSMGKDIAGYGLPELLDTDGCDDGEYKEVTEEREINVDKEYLDLFSSLNNEQLASYNDIMDHAMKQKSQIFFVDGPGGTGKTYLYKALLAKVRSMGQIAIATATSGIAASIMPGGRTAHSRFKIPIKLTNNTMCSFTKQSGTAELLKQASLIIWDEVAMTKRQAVETLDRSLQDIMGRRLPFGGKVVVFGGDFRQVLPVVTRGTRAQITDATLLRSYLWEKIRKIRLTRNMRAHADPWFSEYLLRIGNGTEETIGDDYVRLPNDIVIAYTEDETAMNKLIEDVFPSLHANA
uniref:ATP-dependent DNA helicase n=1 Tax=Hordeum vulgare subsp. vulgare TaxID=112509 RepID=A0A8I6XRH8_HORVV